MLSPPTSFPSNPPQKLPTWEFLCVIEKGESNYYLVAADAESIHAIALKLN